MCSPIRATRDSVGRTARPPEIPLGKLLRALVPFIPRLAEQLTYFPLERRIAPVETSRGLGAHRIALVGATQQRARRGQEKARVVSRGKRILPEGVAATGVFVDEGSAHEGKIGRKGRKDGEDGEDGEVEKGKDGKS